MFFIVALMVRGGLKYDPASAQQLTDTDVFYPALDFRVFLLSSLKGRSSLEYGRNGAPAGG